MAASSKVYVAGRAVSLQGATIVGTGGEADVYSIGRGLALKMYKSPDHPDLQSPDPQERAALRAAAQERLDTAERKLRVFPHNLPGAVLRPVELAYDGPGKGARVVGYTMPYLAGADLLYQYGKRKFRDEARPQGLTPDRVRDVLLDLHSTVEAVHTAGVVIGDFNDLNVLVLGGKAYLVDADSFQYGGFLCRTFQYRFVDPLICDPRLDHLELCSPHTEASDWYAYAVMVLQCLLYVDPYAGLYRPGGGKSKLSEAARPLHRITVFSPNVQYPRPAIHYRALPDDLLHYFCQTFEQDRRGVFPADLLRDLCWTRCPLCGAEHARPACPWCLPTVTVPAPLQVPVQAQEVRDEVAAVRVFTTEGRIVEVTVQGGQVFWRYEQDGELRREDGLTVLRGGLARGMKMRLSGRATHVGQGAQLVTLRPGAQPERRVVDTVAVAGGADMPCFAANSAHVYWIESGRLHRDSALGPYALGDVWAHATRLWVGERFGLGYYRAGGLDGALLFDAEHAGINDHIDLGLPPGQVLDATCVFGADRCWFLAAIKEPRGVTNHCLAIARDGRVLARHSAPEGDGSWLGTLGGKCAAGSALLCPTDDGVARVEELAGTLAQTRLFPGTTPYVDSETQLFAGRDGLYAVTDRAIHLLRLGSPGPSVPTP